MNDYQQTANLFMKTLMDFIFSLIFTGIEGPLLNENVS